MRNHAHAPPNDANGYDGERDEEHAAKHGDVYARDDLVYVDDGYEWQKHDDVDERDGYDGMLSADDARDDGGVLHDNSPNRLYDDTWFAHDAHVHDVRQYDHDDVLAPEWRPTHALPIANLGLRSHGR